MIFVVDQEDRVLYINHKAAEFLRIPAEVGHRSSPETGYSPLTFPSGSTRPSSSVFRTGQPMRSEGPMKIRDEVRWFDHALVPIPDAEGQVTSVLGVSRDITERINAENRIPGERAEIPFHR